MLWTFVLAISLCTGISKAQKAVLQSQNNTFNSTFRLSPAQIAAANISEGVAHDVEVALNFERSNNAGYLIQDDPFYILPENLDPLNLPPPGTILKVEEHTNMSFYTVPTSLSMSRFLYTSEALNGSSVPASAYVLWPYLPRKYPHLTSCSGHSASNNSVFPVIGFAHGTSGQTQACAPSGQRNLWDEFHEPFPMALAGYAVVAPDYAALGVPNGISPYFILPAQANDLFHAVDAAQKQWPSLLSREFVVAGQSQGGGVAWASAQRQYQRPVEGYLGTMAISPFTDILAIIEADSVSQNNGRVAGIAQGLNTVLPDFDLSDWLTDVGVARWNLLHDIKGCGITGGRLWSNASGVQILKDGWNTSPAAMWYKNVTTNGGKPFAGPLLVMQGMEDPNANEPVNTRMVHLTCEMFPDSQLSYSRWADITHVPVLYSGQHMWLDWIQARFNGIEVPKGCQLQGYSPVRGVGNIARDQEWFIEYDLYGI